jgi:hypothetical protein
MLHIIRTLAMMSIVGSQLAKAENHWERFLKSHSIEELGAALKAAPDWPRLDPRSSDDRRFANLFVSKFQERRDPLSAPTRQAIESYATLTSTLGRSGGYLNAILLDTVYRSALNDLAGTVVRYPEKASQMGDLLELLRPGPRRIAGIGRILADQTGDPDFEREFSNWPEAEVIPRLTARFGRQPFGARSDTGRNGDPVLCIDRETLAP